MDYVNLFAFLNVVVIPVGMIIVGELVLALTQRRFAVALLVSHLQISLLAEVYAAR